jgi:hypothetical protein
MDSPVHTTASSAMSLGHLISEIGKFSRFRPGGGGEDVSDDVETALEVCVRIAWILALCMGKRSKRVWVTKAPDDGEGVWHSVRYVSMSAGSTSSEGGRRF